MFTVAVHRGHDVSLYECDTVQSQHNEYDPSIPAVWQSPTLSMFTNGVCVNADYFENAYVMNSSGKPLQAFHGQRGPEVSED